MTTRAWTTPRYSGDEIAIGIAVALALHAIPVMLVYLKIVHPLSSNIEDEQAVSKPVIAANVLKLGHPLDPKKLPDRLVPRQNQAPKKDILASNQDPLHQDAGPPPENAIDSPDRIKNPKNDPFAEDAGRPAQEIGADGGVEGGLETDPNKVHAGDMYALKLSSYFHDRWTIPTVITKADENKLCVVYQINISPRMVIWHLREVPIKKSGNDLYDDSARSMLQKLLDDRTVLPEPPNEVADSWKGHTVNLSLGDGTSCR